MTKTTFYDHWLSLWDTAEAERAAARRVILEDELDWVETPQDFSTAVVIGPETGFRTWGTVSVLSEIPPGGHTGQHKHGEEAIFIVSGTGYSVVDGRRYDWKEASALAIPFGSVHQHVNTGTGPARYLSVMSVHLEHLVGLHRTRQLEEKGHGTDIAYGEVSDDGCMPDGQRIVLHRENSLVKVGGEDANRHRKTSDPDAGAIPRAIGDIDAMSDLAAKGVHHAQVLDYMKLGTDLNGFRVHEQSIGGIMTDGPHEHGGKHAHMEAHIYVLKGHGYSEIDGERYDWHPGTGIHIPGPQTVHQHFNESDEPSELLRIFPGIRRFFEQAARSEFPYLYLSTRHEDASGAKV